jgi:hypothetical protein
MAKRHCCDDPKQLRKTAASSRHADDPTPLHVHHDESTLAQEWPFETDFGDHFETPRRAYEDIKPVCRAFCSTSPSPNVNCADVKTFMQASRSETPRGLHLRPVLLSGGICFALEIAGISQRDQQQGKSPAIPSSRLPFHWHSFLNAP